MATSMAKSGFQSVLRRISFPTNRNFSAHYDDAHEAAKWEKISYAGMVMCTGFAVWTLSKGHPQEQPAYPYMHIQNKEFPWEGLISIRV
ncbi:hypothetical protein MKW94_020411 [Papaver nudicaule]|uniref:Uncharacterized protein n=1 Tax=Papaver nudicaule TaxID=74823 RepID=A0AA41VFL4_PAPNU|nr:hypothetical protein [Papaver nudicaule]